jgi:hypothetical protein
MTPDAECICPEVIAFAGLRPDGLMTLRVIHLDYDHRCPVDDTTDVIPADPCDRCHGLGAHHEPACPAYVNLSERVPL